MTETIASLISTVLVLVYWEVRHAAAKARQRALEEELREIPQTVAQAVSPQTISREDRDRT